MAGWDIQFKDLSVGYNKKPVLEGIDATLPGGAISVILGGSGCGKSTLLRHIAGLAKPIKGQILIGGKDISQLSGKDLARERRRLGMLFQDGALLGSLTLAQNAALPLSEHLQLPKKLVREAALRVLKMVGLEKYGDYYPAQLSGGMRKRAGLARAIIADPRALLCDEPTSGLDPVTAARMDDLLLDLHRRRPEMTIVSVSHDLESLKKIADYVLVLGEGKAIFAGPLDLLLKTPDKYLQEFLSRNPGQEEMESVPPQNPEVAKALQKWLDS